MEEVLIFRINTKTHYDIDISFKRNTVQATTVASNEISSTKVLSTASEMKLILLLTFCLFVLVGANAFSARSPRDVSQLSTDNSAQIYLPPSVENQPELLSDVNEEAAEKSLQANEEKPVAPVAPIAAVAENVDDATVLKPEGYVYKTVRRLRLRTRRDVSHLNRDYLPPTAAIRTPAIHYLPPVEHVRQALELSNEYLPPVELETEAPTTEAPIATTTLLAITTTTEAVTELPTTQALITKELVDDTAVLSEDGYHYKKPDVVPDLSPVREYLPPVEDSIIVDGAPSNNESAALADDGYRYRAIRRFRF